MKNKRMVSFFIALLFIFTSSLQAQQNINYNDPNYKILPESNIKIGTLPNGLKYYIKENKKPEKRAELYIAVDAGAVLEDDDQDGLAHFTEHMCFNGTKNFPKKGIIDFLESIGVKFGADLNAYTNWDQTVYTLSRMPTDDIEKFDKGLDILRDWASNVSFEDAEIDKERGVIVEEWRLGKGAEDRISKKHNKVLFYNSRYDLRDVIGDTAILNHFKYETIRRFYKDWYRPDLMAVIAVGDFNKDEVEKKIIERFSSLQNPATARERTRYKLPPHKETFVSIATDRELSFPNVTVYFKNPDRDASTIGSYRQDIVSRIFTSLLSLRFNELRRKPNPPFLFAAASEGEFVGDTRVLFLFAGAKGDGINTCFENLLTEAFRANKHGFTQTELDRTKKETLRNVEQMYNERDKTESENYAQEYLRNFLKQEPIPGIATELDIYKKFI
ncbi:MAG: pitrilysin family protein, partial [Bacteroidota bacterium]